VSGELGVVGDGGWLETEGSKRFSASAEERRFSVAGNTKEKVIESLNTASGHGFSSDDTRRTSGTRKPWKHHEIDVPPNGVAPFSEFFRQGLVFMDQGLGFEILKPLMHKIEGVVDQLGSLFRRHGADCGERSEANSMKPEIGL
jgi:hypothetical protein